VGMSAGRAGSVGCVRAGAAELGRAVVGTLSDEVSDPHAATTRPATNMIRAERMNISSIL
jgi:hypothetical protein